MSSTEADDFVRDMFKIIRKNLIKDGLVKVKGLGTFKLIETSARESIDVNTHERITIESRNKITFTPEAIVRDRINSPFAQFESVEIADDTDFSDIDSHYEQQNSAIPPQQLNEVSSTIEDNEPIEEPVDEPSTDEPSTPATPDAPAEVSEILAIPETPDEDNDSGDNNDDGDGGDHHLSHSPRIAMILIALIILALVAYGSYRLGINKGISMASADIQEEVVFTSPDSLNVLATTEEKSDTTDGTTAASVVKKPAQTATTAATEKADEQPLDRYNAYPRVATGAYDIVALDTVVTICQGQTLQSISQCFLGPGMECYVEAFNDGIKTVSPGDKLKIPKVKEKEKVKKYLHH